MRKLPVQIFQERWYKMNRIVYRYHSIIIIIIIIVKSHHTAMINDNLPHQPGFPVSSPSPQTPSTISSSQYSASPPQTPSPSSSPSLPHYPNRHSAPISSAEDSIPAARNRRVRVGRILRWSWSWSWRCRRVVIRGSRARGNGSCTSVCGFGGR